MASSITVQQALNSRLTSASPGAAVSASLVAWPNITFVPPATGMWYEVAYLPGESRASGIGADAQNRIVGIFQITVFSKTEIGEGTAITEAERIVACYKRGTVLTYSGTTVRIKRAWRGPAFVSTEPACFQVPVTISFWADVAN